MNEHAAHHCTCFADQAEDRLCEVVDHRSIGEAIYRIRLHWPTLADKAIPGQFVMLRLPRSTDPLLGRAFAIYDLVESPAGGCVDIVYMTLGRMTGMLPDVQPGSTLRVWGPLGNGFHLPSAKHLVLVAGGIGHTPFLTLAKAVLGRAEYAGGSYQVPQVDCVTLCYGARRAAQLANIDDFEAVGVRVLTTTDDGSRGRQGTAVDALRELLEHEQRLREETLVVCCGPKKMMQAAARLCLDRGVRCYLSLETPMACGIGACFSCVVKVKDGASGWDYRRVCVEGPIFDAATLVLDD
ncbi:dihydroorotate dehydrogenase electron transfer subunit [Thermostilla marina]